MRGRVFLGGFTLVIAACGRVGFDPLDHDTALGDALGLADDSGGDGAMGTPEMLQVPATADTTLNSFASTFNYGASVAFNVRADMVNTLVGLVRFDLQQASGIVTSATLHLTTSTLVFSSGRVDIARVLEAWEEGAATGAAGVANYDVRQGNTGWTQSGCGPGSRDAVPVASLLPTSTNTRYDVVLPVSLVQSWIDDPEANHGLALVAVDAPNETVVFSTRESSSPPELTVHVLR